MIKKLITSIIFILLLAKPVLSIPTSAYIVTLPGDWWGTVKINDNYTADDSILNVYVNDNTTPVTSTVVGQLKSNYYLVHIEAEDGDNVSFKVNNISVDQSAQPWSEGDHQLNLSITVNDSFNSSVSDGQSCNSSSDCNSGFCVHNICRPSSPYCGDNFCDSGETCSSCPTDCSTCPVQNQGDGGVSGGAAPITASKNKINQSTTTQKACQESWSCTDWSICQNDIQTRTCTDSNVCGTTVSKPMLSQSCVMPTNQTEETTQMPENLVTTGPTGFSLVLSSTEWLIGIVIGIIAVVSAIYFLNTRKKH